jgi:hypothetical protein
MVTGFDETLMDLNSLMSDLSPWLTSSWNWEAPVATRDTGTVLDRTLC